MIQAEACNPVFLVECTLDLLDRRSNHLEQTSLRNSLRDLVDDHENTDELTAAIYWFLAVNDERHDELVTELAYRFDKAKDELRAIAAEYSGTRIGRKAHGALVAVGSGEVSASGTSNKWQIDNRLFFCARERVRSCTNVARQR
ncbi:hypothetical protein SD72_05605 [Leucobacter komagatae]|uniref:Uncharacterized protein n=1 Tax=Leucobacter komagatae TaxID=55969 RepID=A0A0D0H749_9MICO|nr:hypothetical protein SD72_05605 [Leucobacter komagatae]